MSRVRERLTWVVGAMTAFVLATSGCASKKYVNNQIAPVSQKLNQYEKQTNDRIAWLNNKEQNDVSQLNERIATTDQNLTAAVQAAQGSASRAMEDAEAAKAGNTTNATAIDNLQTSMNNAFNYQLVEKSDVLFGFNKSMLTSSAKATLDDVISKFQSTPRGVVELEGYTDRIGTPSYNMDLSRRRAWAVQRYLVEHNIPLRSIHVIGFGEKAPSDIASSARGERNREARRVNIKVYGAGETTGTTGGSQ